MKNSFFLKLGIGILAIFGVLFAGFVFWKPINVTYYKYQIGSENKETHAAAVKYLLEAGAIEPVRYYYDNKYASNDVSIRLAVVDELCGFGDKGKELMREIFRERCKSEMVLIPAGSFMMGSDNGSEDEKPVHEVTLNSFWMDKYEVTNEKFRTFIECTNHYLRWRAQSEWKSAGKELHPYVQVLWENANAYAKWLNMRLPTEAEWEYACRADSTSKYSFGDSELELSNYDWFNGNSGSAPHSVGMKIPNKWGLFDMHGNAREWCQDWYDENYYSYSPTDNPQGPKTGPEHILRGGNWLYPAEYCRASRRCRIDTEGRKSYGSGFRVCRSYGQ
jgi:formylglycine-generating enzyme required for sulfatase activity